MFTLLTALMLVPDADAATLYIAMSGTGQIDALDLATNTVTTIGTFGTTFNWGGMSWDHLTGTLWMVSGRVDNGLYTVDTATGIATLVGYHGLTDVFSNAVDPLTGEIYALQANGFTGLYALDPASGAASYIGAPSTPSPSGYSGVGGAEFGPNGMIYANASFSSYIYAIDPATGAATYQGDAGVSVSDNGLAYNTDDGMFYLAELGGAVYELDPNAGWAATNIYQGSAYTAAAVEPDFPIGGGGFDLRATGTCPGPVTVTVTGATPNRNVAIAFSTTGGGSFTVPSGPCAGTNVPLNQPRLATMVRASAQGTVRITRSFGQGLCRKAIAAVDMDTCTVTPLVRLP